MLQVHKYTKAKEKGEEILETQEERRKKEKKAKKGRKEG